jgi:sensor histidine kinase YesM
VKKNSLPELFEISLRNWSGIEDITKKGLTTFKHVNLKKSRSKIHKMLKELHNKHKYFFHMLGVLTFVIIVRVLDWLAWAPASTPERTKVVVVEHLSQYICFTLIIFMLIYSYRWALKKQNRSILYIIIALYAILGPVLFLYLTTWLELLIWPKYVLPMTFGLLTQYSPGASLIILFLSSAYYVTYLIEQAGRQRETAHRAESLAKDVQLKMLRYQINPHFLFNVLNSIYTLIDENTEKAKKLVIDMSEYYRYTLSKQQQTVTIEKEIDSILKYLEIQKTRFEEEFHYEIDVDENVKQIQIPTFLIHLLIENSVKYGTKTEKQKLIINLSVRLITRSLFIRVSNTGKLVIPTSNGEKNIDGTGNGIDNLKYRLALYYNDNYTFSLKEEGGFVVATIEITNVNNP